MADQQGLAPQADTQPTAPVKTAGDASRDNREKTRAAREAKAARRFALRNGNTEETKEPEDKEPEAKTEPTADEPVKAEPEEKKPEQSKNDLAKRYAIVERREARIQKRETGIKEREDRVSRAEHNLSARFGDPEAAKKAYDSGNHYEAAKYVQRIFGDDYATITQKIARATAGLSPEKLKELEERDAFQREKREWEAQKKKAEQEKNAGVTREKAVAHVADKCKGHDVLKLRNGAELVLRVLEKHWDTDHFTISFKAAADKVLADKLEEAEALGLKRHSASVVEKKEQPPAARKPPAKKEPEVIQKRDSRLSFEERHALAGRQLAKRRAQ